jgi:hypothetical protein
MSYGAEFGEIQLEGEAIIGELSVDSIMANELGQSSLYATKESPQAIFRGVGTIKIAGTIRFSGQLLEAEIDSSTSSATEFVE